MFGFGRNDQVITDFTMGLPARWYTMDFTAETGSDWADRTAAELLPEGGPRDALATELAQWKATIGSSDPDAMSGAAFVPEPELARVSAVMGMTKIRIPEKYDPFEFERVLAADAGRVETGVEYRDVRTWRTRSEAGVMIGAYNLIARTDPITGEVALSETCDIHTFPPRSLDKVAVFITAPIGVFENIVERTSGIVASLKVTLQKQSAASA